MMSDPIPKIHQYDCLTGETTEREMTDEEIAAMPDPADFPRPE
jgi:hypothetical protein